MEIARCTTQSLTTEGKGKHWSCERFALGKLVFRCFLVDTGEELMELVVMGIEAQLIVSSIADGCTYHVTAILAWLSVERNHYLSMGCMRVAHAVFILYHQHSGIERLLAQHSLISP